MKPTVCGSREIGSNTAPDETRICRIDEARNGPSLSINHGETPKTRASAVGTPVTRRPPQSGRIEARFGLRMMPTFPRSPLSFRTAGFPQYGWKAGMSSGAFPMRHSLSLLPAYTGHRSVCIRPSCITWSLRWPALSRIADSTMHRLGGWVVLRPRGPRSGPGYAVPAVITYSAPSAPLAGTSRFHRFAAYCPVN